MAGPEDTRAAQALLRDVYLSLARDVDEAGALTEDVRKDPSRLNDPWVSALIRWRDLFDREIAAVQAIYEGSEAGKLSPDEIRAGRQMGEKLLETLETARERTLQAA
ncbi:MAG TPA: hypothetical protein VK655_11340 [Solirubrobacteraceae bacterium]|jgi:hypothetical protein|nr:hypothetical protein [Solirubrobacteraceae bacterium]